MIVPWPLPSADDPEAARAALSGRVALHPHRPGHPFLCGRCGATHVVVGRDVAECGACGWPTPLLTQTGDPAHAA